MLDPCCGTGSYLIEVLNRIAETLREKGGDALTAQEIVCFISNYSWLDGLSFTGMRERYLERFDQIANYDLVKKEIYSWPALARASAAGSAAQ